MSEQTILWSELCPRLARYLPANLFNRLRQLPENLAKIPSDKVAEVSQTLLEATKTLEPLHRVLIHYMPRYLVELNPTPSQPHGEILEGSFIFADVTGFTALTEMLVRQGDAHGREVLNNIMNRLFSMVLDPLTASGGDMLVFIGDAVLVYFPKEEHGGDVLQASRAALRMLREIVPFKRLETEYGNCSLTMSVGIERGQAYAGVVGTSQRMELLVSGPGTYAAMQAEIKAEPGQVLLGPQAQEIAKTHFTIENGIIIDDLGDNLGDYEIRTPTHKRGSSVVFGMSIAEILETLQTNLERVERLAPFLPEDMLALLVNMERHRKLQSEFRPVAVQFVNILGIEELAMREGPFVATTVFQRYFTRAKEIIGRHEGIISQIDTSMSGFFFLNTYGVPKSHEGTTRYAVAAALQLSVELDRLNREFELNPPLQQRVGITYGLTFNGEIGAQYRRESVISGPSVNRAYRLMNKGQAGQIIVDGEVWEKIRESFIGQELAAVMLKGIPQPVTMINIKDIRHSSRLPVLKRPMLERQTELTTLTTAMTDLLNPLPTSSAWLVHSETGTGKTTLVSNLVNISKQHQLSVLIGCCQPHSKHNPLSVWIDLLNGWLEFEEHEIANLPYRLRNELAIVGLSAYYHQMAELLALPEIKDAPTVSPVEKLTHPQLLIRLLQRLATRQPLILILEDVQWLDPESRELLQQLHPRLNGLSLMVVLTGQKPLTWPNVQTLPLPPLTEPALIEVAQRTFGSDALDPSLAQWICLRANSNPFYIEELCRALNHEGAIFLDKSTGEVRWTRHVPSLPLSIHELLLARLDELSLPQQELLKRAAVLGTFFNYEEVAMLCQRHLTEFEIQTALAESVQASFLTVYRGSTYYFSHPLMQEAIYTTLSYQQRQTWHTQIGDWLASNPRRQEKQLAQIAYHYLNSADTKQATKFTMLAGDKARERGSYMGASEYYLQVFALTDAPLETRLTAMENHADVLVLRDDYPAAIKAYKQAIELGQTLDNAASAKIPQLLVKQAIIAGDLEALSHLTMPPRLRAWGAGARAWLLAQQGQFETAFEIANTALQTAEGASQTALSVLVENLANHRLVEDYKEWQRRYISAVLQLGMSTIDLLDMASTESEIINKLVRKSTMTLPEIAEAVQKPLSQVEIILNELVEHGHVKAIMSKQQVFYKARFSRKSEKKLSSELWSALDF